MLNLFDPVIYTNEEQGFINAVLKPKLSEGWKDRKVKTKALKNRISTHTIIAQGGRCAYCESPLMKGANEIEHIAPKGLYGEFCYEPYNLVTACTSCNSTSNKGEKDTVKPTCDRTDYSNNKFTIVHPYFDNPDGHFKYMDAEKITFDKKNCSAEAIATINMMHWDDTWAIRQRVSNSKTRDLPIDVLQLVAEIVTYK